MEGPTLTIKGFTSQAQVEAFADWYSGQGEQDAGVWFECRKSEGEIDVDFMCSTGFDPDTNTMTIVPS